MSTLRERIEAAKYRQIKRMFLKMVTIIGLVVVAAVFVACDYIGHM